MAYVKYSAQIVRREQDKSLMTFQSLAAVLLKLSALGILGLARTPKMAGWVCLY